MTDQAQPPGRNDLVGLYAGRIKSRYQRPAISGRHRRSGGGVHTFGRRPAVRQLGSKRGRRAMATLMATAMVASSTPALASSYEIQSGDTLAEIADRHGLSAEELARINGITDPDVIYAGDTLLLSETANEGSGVSVEVGDTVYEIKEGDTLFEIAYRYDVDLNELLRLNDIPNANLIYAGDTLILPTRGNVAAQQDTDGGHPGANGNAGSLHLVARGESLSLIAQRYGVTVEELAAANGIEDVNLITTGSLLNIPAPGSVATPDFDESSSAEQGSDSGAMLTGLPAIQQSLSLSCESAALSMATAYWGYQVSEWVFIENMPYHPNPHHGFRGNMNGPFGGTDDYGVYAGPLSSLLSNYGFVGDQFYTMGDPTELKNRLDAGQPVVVWMSNMASAQDRFYEWYEGERFTLVPQQHVVVAYGYDDQGVHVADPGDGQYRTFSWDDFIRSWSYFDGMSLAVYPKT